MIMLERFQVLTATSMKLAVFWDVAPYDDDDLQLYSPGWTLASLTTALHR
jgi:hypothetical protein